jgi:hypothetical protein
MTTKPPLQKTIHEILHTENESKQNHERAGKTKPQEKKRQESRVTLIQLHTIKPLINKDSYMTGITTYLSIQTLNVNGLNSPIKRHQLANWIKKEDPTICCIQETHLIDRNKHWLRVKANGPRKQAGVAILILDKLDFKPTLIKRDKEGHSILIKGEIHQKEITIINLYAPNVNALNFTNHTLNRPQHSGIGRL